MTTQYPYTSPVGSFAANGYGLFDMAGNMNEWCWDWYAFSESGGQSIFGRNRSPRSIDRDLYYRVTRGGGWSSEGADLRCAFPNAFPPNVIANGVIGFRCVKGL